MSWFLLIIAAIALTMWAASQPMVPTAGQLPGVTSTTCVVLPEKAPTPPGPDVKGRILAIDVNPC